MFSLAGRLNGAALELKKVAIVLATRKFDERLAVYREIQSQLQYHNKINSPQVPIWQTMLDQYHLNVMHEG